MLTFYQWIMRQTKLDSPTGDLAIDIETDKKFPRDAETKIEITNHLRASGAHYLAIDAFQNAWRSFRTAQRRESKGSDL